MMIVKFCGQCGTEFGASVRFCNNCGSARSTTSQSDPTASRNTSDLPAHAVRDLSMFSAALAAITTELPARTSVRQAMAFVTVAMLDAGHRSITLSELREVAGEDLAGNPLLSLSVDRIFNTFLAPTKRDPDALDWLYQDLDPDDRRKKYLRLTPKGHEAAKRLVEAINATKSE